jgi:hypothetical protein
LVRGRVRWEERGGVRRRGSRGSRSMVKIAQMRKYRRGGFRGSGKD